MPEPQFETIRVPIFYGRNTFVDSHDIAPGESPDDLNMDGETPGLIRKRRGIVKFSPLHLGADAITGLYRYYKQNSDRHLLAFCGSQLWGGPGTPPALSVINSGYTPGTFMTFGTMQDWCYSANHEDLSYRWDGSSLARVGVSAPFLDNTGGPPFHNPNAAANGRLTANAWYYYRYRFVYGKLGASNISPEVWERQAVGLNAILVAGLESLLPGSGSSIIPAEAGRPTKIEVWRSLGQPASIFIALDERMAYTIPYYYVDTILVPPAGPINYIDVKGDDELVREYPGNSFSEPYVDLMAAGVSWVSLFDKGYVWTPRAKYIAEHKNRMWFGNVKEVSFDSLGAQTVEDFNSRVYWSRAYQPDNFEDFLDVFPEDGDNVTGLASVREHLVVFKNTHTYAIFGTGPSDFDVRLIDPAVGCVAPRSIASLDSSVFFLGQDGVYAYGGGGAVARVSDKIRPDILAIASENREFAAGGSWQGRYYLAIPGVPNG